MRELGPWDGDRPAFERDPGEHRCEAPASGEFVLADVAHADRRLSRGIDGEQHLLATGRAAVAVLVGRGLERLGVAAGTARSPSRPTAGSVDRARRRGRHRRRCGLVAGEHRWRQPAPRPARPRPARRVRVRGRSTPDGRPSRSPLDDLSAFGHDRWWVVVIKVVLAFVILMVFTLFNIWFERRVVARMQHRIGPNVHGPVRSAPEPRRRREADAEGRHHPEGGRQGRLHPGAAHRPRSRRSSRSP